MLRMMQSVRKALKPKPHGNAEKVQAENRPQSDAIVIRYFGTLAVYLTRREINDQNGRNYGHLPRTA